MTEREKFELAYENTHKPIIARPYPKLKDGSYQYLEIHEAWELWQAATAQAVPKGFVLVPVEPTDKYLAVLAAVANVDYQKRGKLKQRELRNEMLRYFEAMIQAAQEDE